MVKITTKDGSMFTFNITDKKFLCFAIVVAAGHTEWDICLVGTKDKGSLDDDFLAEGWAKLSRDVKRFIARFKSPAELVQFKNGKHLEWLMTAPDEAQVA